jgi:hypothetical protein
MSSASTALICLEQGTTSVSLAHPPSRRLDARPRAPPASTPSRPPYRMTAVALYLKNASSQSTD